MSSIAGHAAAGITAYLCCNRWRTTQSRWAAVPFVAVAVGPDLDYLAVWFLGYAANPRFSHSLLFASFVALMVHRMASRCATANLRFAWLLAAAMSHALLDFLVGAHPVPLLWPFDEGIAPSVGLLPSAGALAIGNVHLWKNLLIEFSVLVPVFALLVAVSRRRTIRELLVRALPIFPIWTMFVVWSAALDR